VVHEQPGNFLPVALVQGVVEHLPGEEVGEGAEF
jgi:hypothetical protein